MKLKAPAWIIISLMSCAHSVAQSLNVDSIHSVIESTKNDTVKLKGYTALITYYMQPLPDSSLIYGKKLLDLSTRLNFPLNQVYALSMMGFALAVQDRYIESLKLCNKALALAENPESEKNNLPNSYITDEENYDHPQTPYCHRIEELGFLKSNLAILYHRVKDDENGYQMLKDARLLAQTCGNNRLLSTVNLLAGIRFTDMKMRDSALNALKLARELAIRAGYMKYMGSILLNLGKNYLNEKDTSEAIKCYRNAILFGPYYPRGALVSDLVFAMLYLNSMHLDSSLYYSNVARKIAETQKSPDLQGRVFQSLAAYYLHAKIKDSIIKYQRLVIRFKDIVDSLQQTGQFGLIEFQEQKRVLGVEAARKEYRNRLQAYGYIAGLFVFLVIAILLWRNNRNTQKANRSLKLQKEETEKQKSRVEHMLTQLKSTQAQLIQSEKMASLGEMTAGIAHEIQNPLNFVNNFSELNNELLVEMKEEINKGNVEGAKSIADDLIGNGLKILTHGKRADAIVKGMLQHSHVSNEQKESTDINAMAAEWLRLAYHGFRAKDKDFQVELVTELDKNIGMIHLVRQDIRSVLLNLYSNAFYAVAEKKRKMSDGYEPFVSVGTKQDADCLFISVKDNANGIPKSIIDKIFQPFFTTKPAGQGTGLGLSLCYDIIKAHGGVIRVETKEGEGSTFVISIPT